jgi:rhodanese-related sulfurtransferase
MRTKSTHKQARSQPKKQSKPQSMNPVALTPAQLKSRQNQLLVIDVRGWLEYWMGHIPGAQRLSRDRILKDIPKDRAIAIACLSGHRSAIAAQWLVTQGYSQVYNLQGGLLAWQGVGYAVQRGSRP